MSNKFLDLAKPAFLESSLSRPDWTVDVSRDEKPLWLNKNENIDPILNQKISSLIPKLKSFSINTYPETAKIYKKLAGMDKLEPENFLLTHGSDGAIRTVFDVFISSDDKIVATRPTFAMYDVYSRMFGAKVSYIDYDFTTQGPSLNFEKFCELIENQKPKLVCLPNPDSPTGTILENGQMEVLLKLTANTGSLLLIDEAYYPIYPFTVINRINEFPQLMVCRSFSKAWGAAGFRIGYLAAQEELMKIIHKSRAMYEIGTFSSELLNLLLDCRQDMLDSVERLKEGKSYFVKELESLGFKTAESHGNFIHVRFGEKSKLMSEILKDVVLYRTDFNSASCLEGLSRFSLAPKEQMEKIINKIKSAL